MGNTHGLERRMNSEASGYEGDLCFVSLGSGGCFGGSSRQSITEHQHQHQHQLGKSDGRGSAEWERSHGLNPVTGASSFSKAPKRPFFVSCALSNCLMTRSSTREGETQRPDDPYAKGQTVLSCGCAHIGCFAPAWLNPAPPSDNDDEQRQHEQRVEAEIARLKERELETLNRRSAKATEKAAAKARRGKVGSVEISAPHLESFRRTTDEFISSHLSMCPDPRARVSLEASAPPPPSEDQWCDQFTCDEEDEFSNRSSTPPRSPSCSDARGRAMTDAGSMLPPPFSLPPPPPPPVCGSGVAARN